MYMVYKIKYKRNENVHINLKFKNKNYIIPKSVDFEKHIMVPRPSLLSHLSILRGSPTSRKRVTIRTIGH